MVVSEIFKQRVFKQLPRVTFRQGFDAFVSLAKKRRENKNQQGQDGSAKKGFFVWRKF